MFYKSVNLMCLHYAGMAFLPILLAYLVRIYDLCMLILVRE